MRVLLISYAFPPVGGAGVQRVLKLVKYLPEHGISPSVLSVENPSVPLTDRSLLSEVPPGVEVVRATTLEPGYRLKQRAWRAAAEREPTLSSRLRGRLLAGAKRLLVPDPQVLWLPGAGAVVARRMLSRAPEHVVFITGPPFSQFALALIARLRPGVGVVLDYRDEWTTTSGVYEMGASARIAVKLEKALLRAAHVVTTATPAFRSELLRRFCDLEPERVVSIENGYDPADFPASLPRPPSDRCVVTYVGTVFRLTRARGLLEAVRRLHEREPDLARSLELRFVGRIVETEQRYFEGSEALGVRQVGYLEHAAAIAELAASHAAVCLLDDVPGAERVYPAKIFEIMYLRRPCLALCPEGALADLVRRHRLGEVVAPAEPVAIAALLERMLRAFRAGGALLDHAPIDIDRFDRRRQVGEFSRVFQLARRLAGDGVWTPSGPRLESTSGAHPPTAEP